MSEKKPDNQSGDADKQSASDAQIIPQNEDILRQREEEYRRTQAERFASAYEQTARATDKVAEATIIAARASVESAKANKAMVWVSVGMLFVTAVQCTYTHYSLKQSAAALNASIEASRTDQRAWLGLTEIKMRKAVGEPVAVVVAFTNTGQTPATNMRCTSSVVTGRSRILDAAAVKRTAGPPTPDIGTVSAVFPNDTRNQPFVFKEKLTQKTSDEIDRGELVIQIAGTISYEDIFGVRHHTNFFAFYDHATKEWMAEATHNDAS